MKNEWIRLGIKSIQALLLSTALFFVLLGVITALLLYTSISESGIFFYGLTAACFSCLMAGLQQGAIMARRGLLWGFAGGTVTFLCIMLLCMQLGTGGIVVGAFSPIQLLPIVCGGIGGIIGANLKK